MEKEYAPTKQEKKQLKPTQKSKAPELKSVQKQEDIKEIKKEESKIEKAETKVEAKTETKETPKIEIKKKEEAVARGVSLAASKRHCMYICDFIKNKPIDLALSQLEEVLKFKRAIPMKGEIPHRKGKMMSGRYPINATKLFIPLLKGLKGNSVVNGLNMEKTKIYYCSANWASRPMKSGGARFKRTHVLLKAKEIESGGKK